MVQQALVLPSDQLGKKVVHGAGYTFLGIFLRVLLTFGSVAILARLLTPADFGYIAMATVVTGFAALFSNVGFSSVLIQRRVITRLQMDTVFWASLGLGVFIATTVFLLSFFGSWLFSEAIAGELLRVMCITFIIEQLATVHVALTSRLMRFHLIFWIQLVPIFVRAATAIVFAWNEFGVWALAYGGIAGSITKTLLYALFVPYLPRFRFDLHYLASTWKANASYFGGGLVFYSNSYIDLLLIGRFLGATALGYYQNARSLTDEVRTRIAIPLQRVLFPAFSSLQNDLPKLQAAIIKSGRLLACLVFPIGIGIAAISDDIVPLLYGDQWLAMIPLLKFLGISIAVRGSVTTAAPIFYSQNKVGVNFRYNSFGTVITVVLVSVGSLFGLTGVAMAVATASLFSMITFRVALGLVGLGWQALASMVGPPSFAALCMWGTIELSRTTIPTSLLGSDAIVLFWHIAVGALTYVAAVLILSPILLKDTKDVLGKFRH